MITFIMLLCWKFTLKFDIKYAFHKRLIAATWFIGSSTLAYRLGLISLIFLLSLAVMSRALPVHVVVSLTVSRILAAHAVLSAVWVLSPLSPCEGASQSLVVIWRVWHLPSPRDSPWLSSASICCSDKFLHTSLIKIGMLSVVRGRRFFFGIFFACFRTGVAA